jgi:endoglucanase
MIRIPVTWYKVADPNNNWTIRADWMARVKQVVDFAVDADMHIILNTHHEETVMPLFNAGMERSEIVTKRFWEQIGEVFKDYNEKLIFEGLNEPRTKGSPAEWGGGTPEERANVNKLNQIFVDTVRAQGGGNFHRVLMVPTYAASPDPRAFDGFVIPDDPNPKSKIVLSIHAYLPGPFSFVGPVITANNQSITTGLGFVAMKAEELGVPVILGEFGSVNKNNTENRATHAEFYVNHARTLGMKCVWWDNGATVLGTASGNSDGFGIISRSSPFGASSTPDAGSMQAIIDGIIRGAGGLNAA